MITLLVSPKGKTHKGSVSFWEKWIFFPCLPVQVSSISGSPAAPIFILCICVDQAQLLTKNWYRQPREKLANWMQILSHPNETQIKTDHLILPAPCSAFWTINRQSISCNRIFLFFFFFYRLPHLGWDVKAVFQPSIDQCWLSLQTDGGEVSRALQTQLARPGSITAGEMKQKATSKNSE